MKVIVTYPVASRQVVRVIAVGAPGPPGMPGSGSGGSAFYNHTQGTAATVWTINHGLGMKPSVAVVDSAANEVIGDVHHLNANSLTVTFGAAFSGTAHLV